MINLYVGSGGTGKTYQIIQALKQHVEHFPKSKIFCWCTSEHITWNKLPEYKVLNPIWTETNEIKYLSCKKDDVIVFDGIDVCEKEFMALIEQVANLSKEAKVFIALRWSQFEKQDLYPLRNLSITKMVGF